MCNQNSHLNQNRSENYANELEHVISRYDVRIHTDIDFIPKKFLTSSGRKDNELIHNGCYNRMNSYKCSLYIYLQNNFYSYHRRELQ